MKNILKFISVLFAFIFSISLNLYSQNANSPIEIEKGSNKLFVVIGVLLIIFIGIVIYLFTLDKKINNLKKAINSNKQ